MLTTDQLGNSFEFPFPPGRIISLVPSQTEYLFDLGLEEKIIGITRFCIYPEEKVKTKEKIGGTKRFNFEKIKSLQPDLIIGNKEENYFEGIEELKKYFPVWMSDIYTLEEAYSMMREVAKITNREEAGERIIAEIENSFISLRNPISEIRNPTIAYFIWRKPYMVAANHTFIHHLLRIFGVKNVFESSERYPEIDPKVLAELKPDFIFLSSEPYSFSEKHFDEFKSFSPASKVILVDGEMFSWYGSRLRLAADYFSKLRKELNLYSSPL